MKAIQQHFLSLGGTFFRVLLSASMSTRRGTSEVRGVSLTTSSGHVGPPAFLNE
jgi:hypothetical protein